MRGLQVPPWPVCALLGTQPRTRHPRQAFCLLSWSPFCKVFRKAPTSSLSQIEAGYVVCSCRRGPQSQTLVASGGSLEAFDFRLSLAVWTGQTEHGFSDPRTLAPRFVAIRPGHGASPDWFWGLRLRIIGPVTSHRMASLANDDSTCVGQCPPTAALLMVCPGHFLCHKEPYIQLT